ncbi:MAG: hypothetical protein LBB61_02075 [Treponema sp.]|nr:hypothetical protein [Treponema sp.]
MQAYGDQAAALVKDPLPDSGNAVRYRVTWRGLSGGIRDQCGKSLVKQYPVPSRKEFRDALSA